MAFSSSQIGSFVKHNHWKNALALLRGQISQINKNKHFNTLSMFYYQKLDFSKVEGEGYFNEKIASNLFYGLKKEFALLPYLVPKYNGGFRKYSFFSAPLRLIYYSIILYLFELSSTFVEDNTYDQIASYYGGKLSLDKDGKLRVSESSIYYFNYFQGFKRRIQFEANNLPNNKVIIGLDIKDYYNEISIPILVDLLDEYSRPRVKRKLKFDEATKLQIISFFSFIVKGQKGIPQTDNDILSSFLANLYLMFGDLFIDTEIQKDRDIVEDYQLIRYVDDIFLSVRFKDETPKEQKEEYIASLYPRLADALYYNLEVQLNQKTSVYFLDQQEQIDELLQSLEYLSPSLALEFIEDAMEGDEDGDGNQVEDQDDRSPVEKLDNILSILEALKELPLDPLLKYENVIENNKIFSGIFDSSISELTKREDFNSRIEDLFDNFNFDLLKIQPRSLITLVVLHEANLNTLKQYLLRKDYLNTQDIYLIIILLCQTGFSDQDLIAKLHDHKYMKDIFGLFSNPEITPEFPGYYELNNSQCLKLAKNQDVIEQIRLRVLSEQTSKYSVALNHLLNEIHGIAWALDEKRSRDYKAQNVKKFLISSAVPHNIANQINNLFDRRNANPVSHPGSDYSLAWGVTQDEYWDYYEYVGQALNYLL